MFNLQHNFASLGENFSSPTRIQTLEKQQLAHYNQPLSMMLGIDFEDIDTQNLLAGNIQAPDSISMVYAGHQFGGFTPQLGDGRGVLLGEVLAKDGTLYDLHMKGAGLTPYSRQGDGRAVLRSCIREYLASESMAALNIASSRALALYDSQGIVYREKPEKGAMLLRTAKTHVRFGHFEFFFYRNKQDELNQLIEYCLQNYFPHCKATENPIIAMLNEVVDRTALMIAKWQAIGFQHGVMNTDNMSLLGETIDYGPYEFMGDYDPKRVCNHSDYEGRYSFERQPGVALWNLNCLLRCFSKHLERDQLVEILEQYEPKLISYYQTEMRAKLGLVTEDDTDSALLANLLTILEKEKIDYTTFFRKLSKIEERQDNFNLFDNLANEQEMALWLTSYLNRRQLEKRDWADVSLEMCAVNPKFILRNYLAQIAIDRAEQGDFAFFKTLTTTLTSPFDEHIEHENLSHCPPEWGKNLAISCSS